MNAAVGVAQIRRLDDFLRIQERNYQILENALSELDGIEFRTIPKTGVQNYSFLNIFLPSENIARKARKELVAAGIDGCFYWYDNNWHYYRKWEHLRELKSLGAVGREVSERMKVLKSADFSASDHWMGRNLSFLIKLGWTEDELHRRAATIKEVLSKVMAEA